ncbi:hypothetical protein ACFPZ0_20685 [Streptomonospora nanhaiensis]|uniref:hypothetical protein n=1 Tax=Streptomonospora nanhaiensis TaxID=1323731 RepID=UPI001C990392|nr:hypothetical protein [Streptomonospora nanhaiensis]MBX9390532.1 hypothetical protein [Streptomonospora nanhaiensis]
MTGDRTPDSPRPGGHPASADDTGPGAHPAPLGARRSYALPLLGPAAYAAVAELTMQHTTDGWMISYDGDDSVRVRYQAVHLARSIILSAPSVGLLARLIATAEGAAAEGLPGIGREPDR